jgi:hypothetical protein
VRVAALCAFQSLQPGGRCVLEDGSALLGAELSDGVATGLFGRTPSAIRALQQGGSAAERAAFRESAAAPIKWLSDFEGLVTLELLAADRALVVELSEPPPEARRAALHERTANGAAAAGDGGG